MRLTNVSDQRILDIVTEIERHLHSPERWFGKSADQSGNNWAADTLTPYQCISGNGVYGADADDEALVIGSDDTPTESGFDEFDLHRLLIVEVSVFSTYKMRIVWGTGTMAEAINAGDCSEFMLKFDTVGNVSAHFPVDLQMPDLDSGTKIWAQCKNATDNATVDFFVGLHEYLEG
jgi:hypothetical protein